MDAFAEAQLRKEAEASVALDKDDRVQTIAVYAKPEGWKTFQITLGLMYNDEPHPVDTRLDANGWIELWAPDEDRAREIVFEVLGKHWAGIYDKQLGVLRDYYYSRGCMARILSYNNQNNYQLIMAN